MNPQPLVSIITPTYNMGKVIGETISSVIGQTYPNWELIIVDDSSSDNSGEIINLMADRDSRIRYFKTEESSGSPSLPRNIGIDKAQGKYIAFLDADDLWFPEKLERQIQFMEENKINFAYSDYEKINHLGERKNRIVKMPAVSSFWDVIETCTIPCLTVVMTRDIIGNTRFKNIAKEDFAFWLDILKKNVKAYNVGGVLALYREQQKSRSSNKIKMVKDQWKLLRQVEGVKPIVASYFMLKYLLYGLIKYLCNKQILNPQFSGELIPHLRLASKEVNFYCFFTSYSCSSSLLLEGMPERRGGLNRPKSGYRLISFLQILFSCS